MYNESHAGPWCDASERADEGEHVKSKITTAEKIAAKVNVPLRVHVTAEEIVSAFKSGVIPLDQQDHIGALFLEIYPDVLADLFREESISMEQARLLYSQISKFYKSSRMDAFLFQEKVPDKVNDLINYGFLERTLCRMFDALDIPEFKGFWCDGVVLSEDDEHYSKKAVNDRRFILLDAWIGKYPGAGRYSVKLKFGRKAMSRYQRGLSIDECFPDGDTKDCLVIDNKLQTLEIQLK